MTADALAAPLSPTAKDDCLDALASRRSVLARNLTEPGPDADGLRRMLEIAIRVPDHGKIGPWRFIIFEGDARAALGEILVDRFRVLHPEADSVELEAERERFLRAPVVVGVVSSPDLGRKIPEWEQRMSAGAVCLNLLNAATMSGFGAQWLTEWCAYDEAVLASLGLGPDEKIAGFVYIGSAPRAPRERPRPALSERVTRFEV